VRLGPLLLTLPLHGAVEGAAELSIRPQALLLAPSGDGLSGQVTKAAYLGDHMEYWVAVTGLDKELFAIATDVERPMAVGDMASVSLAHTGATLVPQRYMASDASQGVIPAKCRRRKV
jgi:iron(III) transport system ATP-binding protein